MAGLNNQEILNKLENNLYKKYKCLSNGNSFLFIENYKGVFVLNWSPLNDDYINYNRVNQIKRFIYNFLKNKGYNGFFYTGLEAIKV